MERGKERERQTHRQRAERKRQMIATGLHRCEHTSTLHTLLLSSFPPFLSVRSSIHSILCLLYAALFLSLFSRNLFAFYLLLSSLPLLSLSLSLLSATYLYVNVYVCMCVYLLTCIYACVCISMFIYIFKQSLFLSLAVFLSLESG